MAEHKLMIHKAAVLGAGVMGAQIAAHLANANIPTLLFDLPGSEPNLNSVASNAIERLKKLKPSPLATLDNASFIQAANYQQHLALLKECDLVIEAIAERLDWKEDLYQKIAPFINDQAFIASNTSGLSINQLATQLPSSLRPRFCGVHFFNPPRYMQLVEIIPTAQTDATLLSALETFLVSSLGKGVVIAKDTPNFIANRVGVFSLLATMYHAEQFNISPEVVDALTGPLIGRAKSATYRTVDVVGLDTLGHVIKTMNDNLPNDPWHAFYKLPSMMNKLIANGALGQKTGAGVFKKVGQEIHVFDNEKNAYQPSTKGLSDEMTNIMKIKNPQEWFTAIHQSNDPQAQFLWACFRDLFHYSAYHLFYIANNVRDIDLAMRWGFGWKQGPFEVWQNANWQQIASWVNQDISANKSMANAKLPAWVDTTAVYSELGAFNPVTQKFAGRSQLPVYQRQLFPESMLAEKFDEGTTIFENASIRFWHQNDGVGIISFKTKANTISIEVLESIQQAINIAEKEFKAVVLWQRRGDHFSVGADLSGAVNAMQSGQEHVLVQMLEKFQQTSLMIRNSLIPVVAAVKGYVFGGGCELSLHCDRIVAALETYVGLVEAGVGLLPAGGGCKEFALRAANLTPNDPLRSLQNYFKMIAMAETSTSALDAKAKGFLREADVVVFNSNELLYVAKQHAIALSESAYRPPVVNKIKVAGKQGIATMQMLLVNYRDGGFISEHDYEIGLNIAHVLCGGDIDSGSLVDENWLLRLEREKFMELARSSKTQARISHTLKTGKPLRN